MARAGQEGVPVIYTEGYERLRKELRFIADNGRYLDARTHKEIRA